MIIPSFIIVSDWEDLCKRTNGVEIDLFKPNKDISFASKCSVHKTSSSKPCNFVQVRQYKQLYYNVDFIGLYIVNVKKCLPCGSGEIDLLRDKKKIKLLGEESITYIRICDGKILNSQEQDKIIPIMITDNPTPHPRKFAHFTVDLIVHVLIKLFHKRCFNFWFNDIIENYAETAYKLYREEVAYTKLLKEATAVFLEIDTFRKAMSHVLNEHLEPEVEHIFDCVARYPLRVIGTDAMWKTPMKMHINRSYDRFKVRGCANLIMNADIAMVTGWGIFPDGKETLERISDLIVKSFVRSLRLSPIYEPLPFSVCFDHPQRDSGLPDVIVPKVKEELSKETDGEVYTSPITQLEYDTSTLVGLV